ncbi:hypothetical protein [Mucilaginibacter gynuensis]
MINIIMSQSVVVTIGRDGDLLEVVISPITSKENNVISGNSFDLAFRNIISEDVYYVLDTEMVIGSIYLNEDGSWYLNGATDLSFNEEKYIADFILAYKEPEPDF